MQKVFFISKISTALYAQNTDQYYNISTIK